MNSNRRSISSKGKTRKTKSKTHAEKNLEPQKSGKMDYFTLADRKYYVLERLKYKAGQTKDGNSDRKFILKHNYQFSNKDIGNWIHAYYRGEYESWDNLNNLSKKKKTVNVMDIINKKLSEDEKQEPYKEFLEVKRSFVVPKQYGLFARSRIECGTHLGYYCGEVVGRSAHPGTAYVLSLGKIATSTHQNLLRVLEVCKLCDRQQHSKCVR